MSLGACVHERVYLTCCERWFSSMDLWTNRKMSRTLQRGRKISIIEQETQLSIHLLGACVWGWGDWNPRGFILVHLCGVVIMNSVHVPECNLLCFCYENVLHLAKQWCFGSSSQAYVVRGRQTRVHIQCSSTKIIIQLRHVFSVSPFYSDVCALSYHFILMSQPAAASGKVSNRNHLGLCLIISFDQVPSSSAGEEAFSTKLCLWHAAAEGGKFPQNQCIDGNKKKSCSEAYEMLRYYMDLIENECLL